MIHPSDPPEPKALVLIPSYDSGMKLMETVRAARAEWPDVWVVVDGSTDGSDAPVREAAAGDPGLRVLLLPRNSGKGAAVLHGMRAAMAEGFTHALTMDADGQHPAALIPAFLDAALAAPDAMILGLPVFGEDAPQLRVRGRRISNWWANVETAGLGIGDSLFGFRVYPIAPLVRIMERNPWMRRFDFDPEAAVRLCWAGVRPVNMSAPVRYLRPEEGGVSHFRYGRDNLLLTFMHLRLVLGMLWRLPWLLRRRGAAARSR
ncbi:glycosyltransferase family 2 protein [Roseococcus sp. SYP-B2431]|uniref:glycosyltransferase family 2 protein n=1 Tax=Roseococcus sp. SYP-B2431 TaxID=2496640 RepID=UPI00104011EF|nr:glycosyltransferase family 2 protein [Roseococcus sp. SYP-B2431]TCH98022.1 glycosyltransferase family 2 protein [Roseococcus sp. SYP-B2431]